MQKQRPLENVWTHRGTGNLTLCHRSVFDSQWILVVQWKKQTRETTHLYFFVLLILPSICSALDPRTFLSQTPHLVPNRYAVRISRLQKNCQRTPHLYKYFISQFSFIIIVQKIRWLAIFSRFPILSKIKNGSIPNFGFSIIWQKSIGHHTQTVIPPLSPSLTATASLSSPKTDLQGSLICKESLQSKHVKDRTLLS